MEMGGATAVVSMLLADQRFPAGSYAHSLGLEQAVADGLCVDGVPAFMAARLELIAQCDARLTVAARRAGAGAGNFAAERAGTGGGPLPVGRAGTVDEPLTAKRAGIVDESLAHLALLDAEHAARCPSPILRESARRLGAQLLRSAAAAWPGGIVAGYRSASRTTPRPVALGVVGAFAGLGDLEVATVALYDDAATVASASLKLLGLDPAQTVRWLVELAPAIAAAAREIAADVRPVSEQPAPAAIGLEIAATAHHERGERLFVS